MKLIRYIASCLTMTIALMLVSLTANALTIDKIIVFGDSLSDNGNLYALSSAAHAAIPYIPIIPKNPPYYTGRFTNGPVWVENLAHDLNVPLLDYAYGGAWVEGLPDSDLMTPFSLGMQVNFYLVSSIADFHKDNHLYVIWCGSNDYIDGRTDAEYATTNTIKNIQSQIEWLTYYGAKNIAVMGIADLSRVPEIAEQGSAVSEAARKLTLMHNAKLETMLKQEQIDHPEARIVYGNIDEYFQTILNHPEEYHLKNVKNACFGGTYTFALRAGMMNAEEVEAAKQAHLDIIHNTDLRSAYVTSRLSGMGEQPCTNPDEYLYWDHVHPTRVMHQVISTIVLSKLNEAGISR